MADKKQYQVKYLRKSEHERGFHRIHTTVVEASSLSAARTHPLIIRRRHTIRHHPTTHHITLQLLHSNPTTSTTNAYYTCLEHLA